MPYTLPLHSTPRSGGSCIGTRRREHSMVPSSIPLPPHSTLEGDCVAALAGRYLRAEKKKTEKKSVHDHTVTIRRSKRYFFGDLPAQRIRSKRFMANRASPSAEGLVLTPHTDDPLLKTALNDPQRTRFAFIGACAQRAGLAGAIFSNRVNVILTSWHTYVRLQRAPVRLPYHLAQKFNLLSACLA